MLDLVQKALSAKRESRLIEFKQGFDPASPGEWCELIKDIVAIANSGGGIIVFGLDSRGTPSGEPVSQIALIDSADIANKISKYTGPADLEFDIRTVKKRGHDLVAFVIQSASIPLVFQRPGTYDLGSGKQRNAFSVGTVYFRHGAKSEPGTSDDIRKVIERQLEQIRKSWIKGVRKVVQAPHGARVIALDAASGEKPFIPTTVRAVNDPNATPVRLTRDSTQASATFMHEEVSDGIFDEINNVIDANRVLSKGQQHFFLGQPIYYRVYAERHHVIQEKKNVTLLFRSGMCEFYAPLLFWAVTLPEGDIAQALSDLYSYPKTPHIHCLLRIAVLLGSEFSEWLYAKWHEKWKRHAQPPSFYRTLKEMLTKARNIDPRVVAARVSVTAEMGFDGAPFVGVKELIAKPERAAAMLSIACMRVFNGDASLRTIARNLDYLAYGGEIMRRSPQIAKATIKAVGDKAAGDIVGTDEPE